MEPNSKDIARVEDKITSETHGPAGLDPVYPLIRVVVRTFPFTGYQNHVGRRDLDVTYGGN